MVMIMENILWEMFKKTGDIKYYLFIKKLGSVDNGNRETRGNSNR